MRTDCLTGKQYFATEHSAATMAVYFEGQRPTPLYWYQCEFCNGYHITSKERRNGVSISYYSEYKTNIIRKNTVVSKKSTYKSQRNEERIANREAFLRTNPSIELRKQWNIENPSFLVTTKIVEPETVRDPAIALKKAQLKMLYKKGEITLEEVISFNNKYPNYYINIDALTSKV